MVRALCLTLFASASLAAADEPSAQAVLKDPLGKEVGTATFVPTNGGVKVSVEVTDLPAGEHGIHIHDVGKCEPPAFTSASRHFNPFGKQHGLKNPEGAHAGDMPNLTVGKDGRASATFIAHGATLGEGKGSLLDSDGTALIIHADQDNQKTDPAGNSGTRIACGVIEKK